MRTLKIAEVTQKHWHKSRALLAAGLLGAAALLPGAAMAATDVQVHLSAPGLQLATYGHNRYRGQQRRYHDRRSHRRNFRNNPRSYSRRHYSRSRGHDYRRSGTTCHRVSKHSYWRGYPALVGGRQCINRYGEAYIVPNSRYLIRYH